MDTKRVSEIIKKIEAAEAGMEKTRAEMAALTERLVAQQKEMHALQRELARSLSDVLPQNRRGAGSRGRSAGITVAILELYADRKPHDTAAVTRLLDSRGLNSKNAAIALSSLVKRGRLQRVGRGVYKAASQQETLS